MTKEEYGYSNMFAVAGKDLNEHIEHWSNAFDPSERLHFLTATMMLINRYSVILEEKDKLINQLKEK